MVAIGEFLSLKVKNSKMKGDNIYFYYKGVEGFQKHFLTSNIQQGLVFMSLFFVKKDPKNCSR